MTETADRSAADAFYGLAQAIAAATTTKASPIACARP
jgi:hypothetical protein